MFTGIIETLGKIVNIRKEAKNSCVSFWLDLSIKLLLPRLKNNTKRPLLDHRKLEQSVNKIYSLRKKIYNESSFKIKCDILDKDAIVNKIINLYEISRDKI